MSKHSVNQAVDRREKIASFVALALVTPEPRKVKGHTQLPEFGALPLRYCQRLEEAVLRCSVLMHRQQQRPPQPMHFSLGPTLLCLLG